MSMLNVIAFNHLLFLLICKWHKLNMTQSVDKPPLFYQHIKYLRAQFFYKALSTSIIRISDVRTNDSSTAQTLFRPKVTLMSAGTVFRAISYDLSQQL